MQKAAHRYTVFERLVRPDRELADILHKSVDEIEAFELQEISGFRARVASWLVGLRCAPIFTIPE